MIYSTFSEAFLIIYAVNIHTGGGRVLLDEVIKSDIFGPVTYLFHDARYTPPQQNKIVGFFSARKSLLGRFKAELNLHKLCHELSQQDPKEEILFFGNIPPFKQPLFKSKLYLQNCYLTRQIPLPSDSFKETLRCWLESILLKFFAQNVSEILVQSKWMLELTQRYLPKAKISLKPILPSFPTFKTLSLEKRPFNFLYVGSLSTNKRLSFFISALILALDKQLDNDEIQKKNILIILDNTFKENNWTEFLNQLKSKFAHKQTQIHLFADANDFLKEYSNMLQQHTHTNNVIILTRVPYQTMIEFYQKTQAYISTSRYESFGLPLFEAHHFNCVVIGPQTGHIECLPFFVKTFKTDSEESLANILKSNLF